MHHIRALSCNRWVRLVVLTALPLALYLILLERRSWLPHTFLTVRVPIASLAYSPDGRTLAVATNKPAGKIALWDVPSRNLLSRIDTPKKFIGSVSFSRDGRTLAGITWRSYGINLWDVETGKVRLWHPLNTDGPAHVAFWPDSDTLTTIEQSAVNLWNRQTKKRLHSLRHPPGEFGAAAFSPDGKILAGAYGPGIGVINRFISGENYPVQLWGARSGKLYRTLPKKYWATALAFSPEGRILAVGCYSGEIALWDWKKHKITRIISGHGQEVTAVAFSPDGSILASGGQDGIVKHWRIK